MANYKLSNDYWETSGIYDLTEGKTQRAINADLKSGKLSNPPTAGTSGQILRSDGQGGAVWDNAATSAEIGEAVTDWLDENIPIGQTVAVDTSLSISGAAADSKTTGDAIAAQSEAFNSVTVTSSDEELDDTQNLATTLARGYYTTSGGTMTFNNNASFSHMKINVTAGTKLRINKTHNVYTIAQFSALGCFVDAGGNFISTVNSAIGTTPTEEPYDVTAPSGTAQLYLNTDYASSASPVETTVYKYISTPSFQLKSSALNVQPTYYEDLASEGKKVKLVAGTIRNSGNGWELLSDANHEPLNISSVSVNNEGQIVIGYGFTAKKVISLVACPDETFANKYDFGASVGVSESLINVYTKQKSIGGLVRYNSTSDQWVYSGNSNFTGVTFDDTGNLTLSHEDLTGYPLPDIYSVSADGNSGNVQIVSVGYTSVIVKLFDGSGNAITSPVNNTSVYVIRNLNGRLIDASNVSSESGNIWIFGVMEVD